VLNDAAYDYMRKHSLSAPLIVSLRAEPRTCFADQATWVAYLDRLGFTKLDVTPDPVRVATEGALWGSVQSHKFLCDAVVLSDDAGQFNVGQHALCWVHAERPVHKLDTFTDRHRAAQTRVRGLRRLTALLGISPLRGTPVSRLTGSSQARAGLAHCARGSTASSCAAPPSARWTAC
jgi:hypothetical protein